MCFSEIRNQYNLVFIELTHRRPSRPEDGTALASGTFGPQSPIAPANSPNVDCDFYTSDLCIDVSRYPRSVFFKAFRDWRAPGNKMV